MMNIKLKERKEEKLSELTATDTFKIQGSSFVFMKVDVGGLTVQPKKQHEDAVDPKPVKVLIPEGKTTVVNLNTGKVQFLNQNEEVQIVELEATEIVSEKESK